MYKSNHFNNPLVWLSRLSFVAVTMFVIGLIAYLVNSLTISLVVGLFIICLFIILISRITDLSIDSNGINIETKSLIPFLSSRTFIDYKQIKSIRVISDQTLNDRGWQLTQKQIKSIVEVNYDQSKCVRIRAKMHPNGTSGIVGLIEKYRKVK